MLHDRCGAIVWGSALIVLLLVGSANAIDCSNAVSFEVKSDTRLERPISRDVGQDQMCIWTGPLYLRGDRNWTLFVPWAAGTSAGLLGTDRWLLQNFRSTAARIGQTGDIAGNHAKSAEGSPDWWKLRPARSPYLPIDSHYYAMFDLLIAMGYIDTAIVGQRPWSRYECARLVREAEEQLPVDTDGLALTMLDTLKSEFGVDSYLLPEVQQPMESVYARVEGITGEPLRDSFHFGQTIQNDYGRPYWQGMNAYVGASGAATAGPIAIYARGEYQYASGGPVYLPATQDALRTIDQTPRALVPNSAEVSRFKLIEGYAAVPIKDLSISVGKQSLQWGTATHGGMLFSNNTEPIYMVRLSQISPVKLPSVLGVLGPVRFDAYFGKLGGHEFPQGPYTHGQKLTFKPTENLELGFSRTVVFAGEGHPLTFGSFWRSFISTGDNPTSIPGSSNDVGDRRGGFDFAYRVPWIRNWLTIYADMFTDDDPSPLSSPNRSAFNPGIYLTHFPRVRNMDLRVEAPTTALPDTARYRGLFFYYNGGYRDGYTNYGQILGNAIGRQAKGVQATTNYWFTPDNVLQLSYRHSTLDQSFIPQGGNYTDARAAYRRLINRNYVASGFVQIERWNIPLLMPGVQHDTTISIELTWQPR
jgi:hypothetical protein